MTALRHATPTRLRQHRFPDFYRVNHQPVFRALAASLGDAELAREAVDEAMTRAFQRWSTVSTYANAPGWVYRVALNWARSRLRKQKREDLHDAPPERPSTSPSPTPTSRPHFDPFRSNPVPWWSFATSSTGATRRSPPPSTYRWARPRAGSTG